MVTSEEIREEALRLAQSKTDMEEAVADILARCSNKRVAVVRARQSLTDLRQQDPGDDEISLAVDYLDVVLERGPWTQPE